MIETIIDNQGLVGVTDTILYKPLRYATAEITAIRINNSVNASYTFTLYRYVKNSNKKTLIYNISCNPGDKIIDDTVYKVNEDMSLIGVASSSTVSYSIMGSKFTNQQ